VKCFLGYIRRSHRQIAALNVVNKVSDKSRFLHQPIA
jgi:hypothetical protein